MHFVSDQTRASKMEDGGRLPSSKQRKVRRISATV